MTEEAQKKTVGVTYYGSHIVIEFPNGSWIDHEFESGDIMGWDSRLEKNFSSLMSSEEAE
jgi:hypothetical protein